MSNFVVAIIYSIYLLVGLCAVRLISVSVRAG